LPDSLPTVATYFQPIQAELARARLVDEEIPAFIQGGEFAAIAWHLALADRGIKVQVPTEFVERAREVLSPTSNYAERPLEDRTESDDDSENETDEPLSLREQNADRAFRGAVIGVLFIPLQIYAFWLLMKVLVSHEALSSQSRTRAIIAAAINLPLMVFLCVFAISEFRH
jgi:hypothetical protein